MDADGSNVRSIFGFLNDRDRALKALRAVNRPMDVNRAIVNAFAAKQALRDASKRLDEARSLTLSDAQLMMSAFSLGTGVLNTAAPGCCGI